MRFVRLTSLIVLISIFCSFNSFGKPDYYNQIIEKNNSLLYKIENTKNTIYIYGSTEIGNEKSYPLPLNVKNAIKESDALIVENGQISFDDKAKYAVDKMFVGEGSTIGSIQSNLTKVEWDLLNIFMKNYTFLKQTYEESLDRKQAWVSSVFFERILNDQILILNKAAPYYITEGYFVNLFTKAKKPVVKLENIDGVMKAYYKNYNEKEQIGVLKDFLYYLQDAKHVDFKSKELKELYDVYKKQDYKALADYLAKSLKAKKINGEINGYYKSFLDESWRQIYDFRHQRWASILQALADNKEQDLGRDFTTLLKKEEEDRIKSAPPAKIQVEPVVSTITNKNGKTTNTKNAKTSAAKNNSKEVKKPEIHVVYYRNSAREKPEDVGDAFMGRIGELTANNTNKKTFFVCINFRHLYGEDSLIRWLSRRGLFSERQ